MSVGVYLLSHVASWRFYIGSSMCLEDRRERWFRTLRELSAARPDQWRWRWPSRRFVEAACGTKPSEWRFRVVRDFDEHVPERVVRAAEFYWMERGLRVAPALCLNREIIPRGVFRAPGAVRPDWRSKYRRAA